MDAGAGQARYGFISRAACIGDFLGKQRLNLLVCPRAIEHDWAPALTVSHCLLQARQCLLASGGLFASRLCRCVILGILASLPGGCAVICPGQYNGESQEHAANGYR